MKRFFILISLILVTVFSAFAQRFPVKVVGISDGDTFTAINRDNLQLKIRIYGIDAPERGQDYGSMSKKALSGFLFGNNIEIDVLSQEKWGRFVAKVYTNDEKDVALLMLQSGMAWHYKKYDNSQVYKDAEETARKAKRGIWGGKSPVPPWDYRKNKKK